MSVARKISQTGQAVCGFVKRHPVATIAATTLISPLGIPITAGAFAVKEIKRAWEIDDDDDDCILSGFRLGAAVGGAGVFVFACCLIATENPKQTALSQANNEIIANGETNGIRTVTYTQHFLTDLTWWSARPNTVTLLSHTDTVKSTVDCTASVAGESEWKTCSFVGPLPPGFERAKIVFRNTANAAATPK